MRILLLVMVMIAVPAAAQVYRHVAPDGTVTYSDSPVGGEAVEVVPVMTVPATPLPAPAGSGSADEVTQPRGYEGVTIVAPASEASVRENSGAITVQVAVLPGLAPGHSLDIVLDGQVVASGRSTSVTLANVDRGAHTASAVVRDAEGAEVVTSAPSTFFLLRAFKRN